MRVNAKLTICFACAVACALFTGFIIAYFLPSSTEGGAQNTAGGVQDDVDCSEGKDRHDSDKVKRVALGGGVSLKESVFFEPESGEVRSRFSTITRDGERVMMVHWSKTGNAVAGPTLVRSYWQGNKLLLSEGPVDGSARKLLYLPDCETGGPLHLFDEKKDGSLVPVSAERLAKMQEEYRFMLGAMTPIHEGANEGVNEQEASKLVENAVAKVKNRKKPEDSAALKDHVDRSAAKGSHDSPGNKLTEFGGGVLLKEVVRKSESGEVRYRRSTIIRDGKRIMMVVWNGMQEYVPGGRTTRSYWQGDKLVLTVGPEDGGGCDVLVLHDDAGTPMQAFDDKKDGSLVPVSTERLTKTKEEGARRTGASD